MYKVLTSFTDLQDDNYKYACGDVYPHKGAKVSDARIAELLSDNNRRHRPVIEEVPEEKKEEVKEVKKSTPAKAPAKKAPAKKTSTSGRKKS